MHGLRPQLELNMGAHRRKCDWCGSGTPIVRDMDPVNTDYQYWCEECARALIIKGDPIETYRELEGEPIYGRLLEAHCTLKRFYSFATA
ncbi:hypothetical protein GCM10010331_67710 [Streptomyces xanthochromogenes]|nr:hypothetical protein GCM10010289_43180 [Streptomyces violascens]GGY23073.1 hypothetical protein GCM10010326_15670 [Streptomyces xanthochromogenes]GHB70189.1 hypothetical protein GCM10010331_67710 [Streptomyces xanthochromogenes]GHI39087.1 hypothetical protein Sviol_34950 [Streptomyces violascens]